MTSANVQQASYTQETWESTISCFCMKRRHVSTGKEEIMVFAMYAILPQFSGTLEVCMPAHG